ncbi:putative membrane protein [Streptacidiphilus sp. MAP12-16]|uniref:TMEM175 family protein n=1 Tax=Streptacidiphilus sp. MAP12-16 TaxID=3156300 RepID=UPI003513D273
MANREPVVGVERLLLFGDAVFAIAITLLSLDITVPSGLTGRQLNHSLRDLIPSLGAYALSFGVIGVQWLAHHSVLRNAERLDTWLIRIDFVFLATIAALPFPARLLSEYGSTAAATAIYAGSIVLASACTTALALRLRQKPALRKAHVPPDRIRRPVLRSSLIMAVFGTSIPITLASPSLAKYWWLLCIPALRLMDRAARKPDGPDAASAPAQAAGTETSNPPS